jgi:hypothetical protein
LEVCIHIQNTLYNERVYSFLQRHAYILKAVP